MCAPAQRRSVEAEWNHREALLLCVLVLLVDAGLAAVATL